MIKYIYFIKAIVSGFSTGVMVSVPLGPSGIESMRRTITSGFREGFMVSLGAILADIIYIIAINLGFITFFYSSYFTKTLFLLFSGIILILINNISIGNNIKGILNSESKFNGVFSGFIITFLNPATPSIWIGMSSTIIHLWKLNGNHFYDIALIFMICGSICWFAMLNLLAEKGFDFFDIKQKINLVNNIAEKHTQKLLKYFLNLLGASFIAVALYRLLL